MMVLLGIAAIATMSCRGPASDVPHRSAEVAAQRDVLNCGGDEASLPALWNAYERLAVARLNDDPSDDLGALEASLNAVTGAKELDRDHHGAVRVRSAGVGRAFLFASYHCGFFRGGGRLTLLGKVDGAWRSLDRIDIEPELEASLPWTSDGRAIVVASHLGTQFDRARITAVRVDASKLDIERTAEDLLSLDLSTTAEAIVLRYESLTFPLTLGPDAPRPAYEETWTFTDDTVDVVTRHQTPWLDAVASACRAPQPTIPCHGTLEDVSRDSLESERS
jgi:hypothetical protein